MYISCIFHVICASFSALAMRELADANPVSSGIWALLPLFERSMCMSISMPYVTGDNTACLCLDVYLCTYVCIIAYFLCVVILREVFHFQNEMCF